LADAFNVTDNVTISDNLILTKLSDDGNAITLTGNATTTRTISGSGSLEGSTFAQTPNASLTSMTGVLGSAVTGSPTLALTSAATFPSMSKVGVFTYDTATASGTQAITGVGFTPSALTLFAALDTAGQASYGIGAPDMNRCVVDKQNWVSNYWVPHADNAIYMIQTSSIYSGGIVQSFDADGFTISWTKTGAKTGTVFVYYTAVR
jgi:hypothetical protein